MKYKKIIAMMTLVFMCTFMVGCWDKVEIDKRLFISMIGIDPGKDIDKEEEMEKIKQNEPFSKTDMEKLNITYGFPDISELGPQKGAQATEKHISVSGYSMENSVGKATEKSSRALTFGHLKLLLLNEGLVEHEKTFKEVIDYIERQPAINRMIYLSLTNIPSSQIVEFKPNVEKDVEAYIEGIMNNNKNNNTSFPTTLDEFLENLSTTGNSVLPVVSIDKKDKELKISELALIKDYKIVGSLSINEGNSIELVKGNFKKGTRSIVREGSPIDYSIEGFERKIKLNDDSGKLSFDINLSLEGQIKNYNSDKNIFSKKAIDEIEEDFNQSIKQEIDQVIKVTQSKYDCDVVGLGSYLYKYHPKTWKKVKDDWDNIYKKVKVNINVDTNIRRVGSTK
ncbi:Ger(x)C family spore germination protein [Clostridium oceanicum]|uniref:Ger(X)C family spore germination protein n=1 Tax=Clostridium oceanicum TaxID=1543 RepID=A0ABN1JPP1_9CLOT